MLQNREDALLGSLALYVVALDEVGHVQLESLIFCQAKPFGVIFHHIYHQYIMVRRAYIDCGYTGSLNSAPARERYLSPPAIASHMDKRLNIIDTLLKALGVGQQSAQSLPNAPQQQQPFEPPIKGQAQCLSCKKYKMGLTCQAYRHIPPEVFGNMKRCRYFSSKIPKQPKTQQPPAAPAQQPPTGQPPV